MGITDHAFMFGQYALAAPFCIDPTVLGVPAAPVVMFMMVMGAMPAGGLLGAKYHAQILAIDAKIARNGLPRSLGRNYMLKGAKQNMWMWRMPTSPGELCRIAPPGVVIAAGAFVLVYHIIMCWYAYDASEGGVALESWALHVGFWGCVVGMFGIIWGMWKWRNPNLTSHYRNKMDKTTRRRLRRAVTHAFLDDQQVFTAPCPGRIEGLRKRK